MKENKVIMSYSTKMRLAYLFIAVSIALGITRIIGTWRTEVVPNWVTLAGEVSWPVMGIGAVFLIWAKNSKPTN